MNSELEGAISGPSPLSKLFGDGPRPHKVIAFPSARTGARLDAQVAIHALVDHEMRQARINAIKYLFDVCKLTELHLAQDTSLADEEVKTQILFEALRDPTEPRRRFAGSANELRTHLQPDEREALFAAYLEFVDERSPLKKVRTPEEIDEVATALGKGWTGEVLLSSFDTSSLKNILRELAARHVTLMKEHSSLT